MATALLMCDFQEAWCRPGSTVGEPSGIAAHMTSRDALDKAVALLAAGREKGWVVAHTRVGFEPGFTNRTNRSDAFGGFEAAGMMLATSSDAQICPEVEPLAGEPVLLRGWVNPFASTMLDAYLQARNVSTLVIAGVATNFVVESAVRHAGDAGFEVIVAEDACATYSQEMHEFAVESIFSTWGTSSTVAEVVGQ
jgi:nicotinamidase-related amidase